MFKVASTRNSSWTLYPDNRGWNFYHNPISNTDEFCSGYTNVNRPQLSPPSIEQLQKFSKFVLNGRKRLWEQGSGIRIPRSTGNLVGGDPEFFVVNKTGTMVPSFAALGITRLDKQNFADINSGNFTPDSERQSWYHQDGYQLELGYTPVQCLSWNADALNNVFTNIRYHLAVNSLQLSSKTMKKVGPRTVSKYGMVELGCRPSLNAYGEDTTIVDTNPVERFTGGHFHFGWDGFSLNHVPFPNAETSAMYDIYGSLINLERLGADWLNQHVNPIVKALDVYVGVLSLALGGEYESPKRRIMKYGRAGDYRLTTMTLEYRTPANPVWFHPVTWHMIAMVGRIIAKPGNATNGKLDAIIPLADEARGIINATDYKAARNFIVKHRLMGQQIITNNMFVYSKTWNSMIERGLAGTFGDDIMKNWQVGSGLWLSHSEGPNCSIAKTLIPATPIATHIATPAA